MRITIRIPEPLRKLVDNQPTLQVDADTVGELLAHLRDRYSGVYYRLMTDEGQLRRFVNIYVNEENIRFLQDQQTPLKEGDEISIVPATAGG